MSYLYLYISSKTDFLQGQKSSEQKDYHAKEKFFFSLASFNCLPMSWHTTLNCPLTKEPPGRGMLKRFFGKTT